MIGDIQQVARAWVLPHPERQTPNIAAMVADPEIERIAVQFAIKHEQAQGRIVESVEKDNRGFDLISRKPHPEDPKTAIDVRFIEVKGRAETGDIALTSNEYNTAKRLKKDYYLYIVPALRSRLPAGRTSPVAQHLPGPRHPRLATHRQSRALPPAAGFLEAPRRAKGRALAVPNRRQPVRILKRIGPSCPVFGQDLSGGHP